MLLGAFGPKIDRTELGFLRICRVHSGCEVVIRVFERGDLGDVGTNLGRAHTTDMVSSYPSA